MRPPRSAVHAIIELLSSAWSSLHAACGALQPTVKANQNRRQQGWTTRNQLEARRAEQGRQGAPRPPLHSHRLMPGMASTAVRLSGLAILVVHVCMGRQGEAGQAWSVKGFLPTVPKPAGKGWAGRVSSECLCARCTARAFHYPCSCTAHSQRLCQKRARGSNPTPPIDSPP